MTNEREDYSEVRIRRSPRYLRFMGLGAAVGVIAALILTVAFPAAGEFSPSQVFGFLGLFLVVAGGAIGAVVALIIDRAGSRRARPGVIERVDASAGIGEGTPGQPDVGNPSGPTDAVRPDDAPRT